MMTAMGMMSGVAEVIYRMVPHGSREYWQAVTLREEVLRKPLGLSFSEAELWAEDDSYHVVGIQNDRVVGCVVLKPVSAAQVRMRQLCVAEQHRCRGIGTALVIAAEKLARELGFGEMVLHARETAVGFYEKLGYRQSGDCFIEVRIPHVFMSKRLRE